jgi:hypothetical protein
MYDYHQKIFVYLSGYDTDTFQAAFMIVDMYLRLNDRVNKATAASLVEKKSQ